jgi:hypothetical protein
MDNYCSDLRESVEVLAILHSLSREREESVVGARISSLLDRKDSLLEIISSVCGRDLAAKYEEACDNIGDEKLLIDTVKRLHECMVRNGCESNVFLEE